MKRDVVPGMYTTVWFEATHVGHDDIICAEYCGGKRRANGELPYQPSDDPLHPYPPGRRRATGRCTRCSTSSRDEDFTKFLKSIGDKCDEYAAQGKPCPDSVARRRRGRSSTRRRAASRCHTTTGAPGVGPSWKGIWGKQEATNVGTVTRRRELHPRVDPRPAGEDRHRLRPPMMPTFRGQITDAGDRRGHRVHQVALK